MGVIQVYITVGDNLLAYLSERGPSLDPMVFRNISIAICIISKLSWMEDRHQRSLLSSIDSLANQGPEFFILGLNMMADFVEQMDIPYLSILSSSLLSFSHAVDSTEHRKTVTQFISESLLTIFETALEVVDDISSGSGSEKFSDFTYRNALLQADMKVLSQCLQFDFIGCKSDESADETWVLQIPALWEGFVCNSERLARLFAMYPPSSASIQATNRCSRR